MKKRLMAFMVIAIVLVVISAAYAEMYCPFCGAIGYREKTEYISQSYKAPCSHHTYGADTINQTYRVVTGTCTVGGVVYQRWYLYSSSTSCGGWTDPNCYMRQE